MPLYPVVRRRTAVLLRAGRYATLPADFTFTSANYGIHVLSATLATNGNETITATDPATASVTGSASICVSGPDRGLAETPFGFFDH